MKVLFIQFVLGLTICFAQQQEVIKITHQNNEYLLDSIFPIDNIVSITVRNYSGEHTLTSNELTALKEYLKKAKFAGGLLIKPGHITLSIKLKENTVTKSGFVYASKGCIHFDEGVDKFKQPFSGTFYLPVKLNFDNYK
ncbi:MAG: hypothetical protein WC150_11945 [Bacteroidia bacterium]